MQICIGMIGISPVDFWEMSVIEINMAIEGFKEFNTSEESRPMNRNELKDLMELHPD